jgi:hypothetical protein
MSVGETLILLVEVCRLGEPLVTPLEHVMGATVENRPQRARMKDGEVKSLLYGLGDITWLIVIPAPATHFPIAWPLGLSLGVPASVRC